MCRMRKRLWPCGQGALCRLAHAPFRKLPCAVSHSLAAHAAALAKMSQSRALERPLPPRPLFNKHAAGSLGGARPRLFLEAGAFAQGLCPCMKSCLMNRCSKSVIGWPLLKHNQWQIRRLQYPAPKAQTPGRERVVFKAVLKVCPWRNGNFYHNACPIWLPRAWVPRAEPLAPSAIWRQMAMKKTPLTLKANQ
mgnify:CR=1 FL=1